MKRFIHILTSLMLLAIISCSPKVPTQTQAPDDERMDWWREASFGMFIHWGLYAVPGGIYKGDTVKGNAEWIMDKLSIPVAEYEQFAGQFNPVKFNADEWVAIAKDAGMKYIVITSKHHDGFALWDSEISDYDIMDASPFQRDILAELKEACDKADITLCFYHSIMDWHHPQAQAPLYPNYNVGRRDKPRTNPEFPTYYESYLKPQVKELLTNYGDVGVMWFDGEWIPDYTTDMGKDMYQFVRDLQPNTIINNRVDKGRKGMAGMDKEGNFAGDFGTPEKEIPDTGIEGLDWESCLTMNDSWGVHLADHNWKSEETLIRNLIEIVSKGGNLLLNVGPTAEGLIPEQSVTRLAAMGDWLEINGESIFDAKASPYEKPDWGRYTSKEGAVYAHIFDWPEDGRLSLHKDIEVKQAALLAEPGSELEIEASDSGTAIVLPETAVDDVATVVKITY